MPVQVFMEPCAWHIAHPLLKAHQLRTACSRINKNITGNAILPVAEILDDAIIRKRRHTVGSFLIGNLCILL